MSAMKTIRTHARTLALALAVLAPAAVAQELPAADSAGGAAAEVIMVRFRTGALQWGSIADHTAESVTFQRLDTGGLVTMPWSMLAAEQELDLRTRFGYVDLAGEELKVAAEKIVLADGREVIGRIQDRTDDAILFLSEGKVLSIPKQRVRSHVGGLQVPALDVFTKEDLYRQEEQKTDLETPEGQFALAEFCERILDYKRALEHYTGAQELDETFKAQELAVILERIQEKVDNQEQVDFLANVDHLRRRKKFGEAFEQLALFDATYPGSPLVTDRLKMEERVVKSRDDFMHVEVARSWFSWMGRIAARMSREHTFEGTLAYLEEDFSQEIVRNVTEAMRKRWPEVEEDQIRQYFIERKVGRWKPASYGLGTWLLGEDAALKGSSAETQKEEPKSARDKERAEQAEKIKRWLRNQEMAKRASKSEEDEAEVEKAWKLLQSSARRNWIIAYYAENSGELFVRPKPELQNCSECGGTGVRDVIYTGSAREGASSGRTQVPCPTCHSIGRVRRIRYR